jgi:hypothetical protein
MFLSVAIYCLFMKFAFLYGLVRIQVKFDMMKDHWLFLGILYACGAAFLSYVFLFSWQVFDWPTWQVRLAGRLGVAPWQSWLGMLFLLSILYFWLMAKYDEGVIFWTVLLLGIPFVLYI